MTLWLLAMNQNYNEFDKIVAQLVNRFRGIVSGAGGSKPGFNPFFPILLVLGIWLATGIYFIAPDEEGVVLRFGSAVATTSSGPHWHLPWPIERVLKPQVTKVQKVEVGFRTVSVGPPARYKDVVTESQMLTGDENIVSLEFIVQFKIKNSIHYLFNVRDPRGALRDAAESAMRQTVGKKEIDEALTTGKGLIQNDAQVLLQQILDSYQAGIQVLTIKLQDVDPPKAVNDAFKDVINAQQDKERAVNEALGYRNDIIPKSRGVAEQTINQAKAYKEALVKNAEGESERFLKLYKE
jgi:membrane protease subunit HflK